MIEGVVHHLHRDGGLDRQYVDSHGQSTVAFRVPAAPGFSSSCHGCRSDPCAEASRPDIGQADRLPELAADFGRSRSTGKLIRQQYDQMIKYVTAVRLGTAERKKSKFLRRLPCGAHSDPTYKASPNSGQAGPNPIPVPIPSQRDLRRKFNEGLNVIGANEPAPTTSASFAREAKWSAIVAKIMKSANARAALSKNLAMVYITPSCCSRLLAPVRQMVGKLTAQDLRRP